MLTCVTGATGFLGGYICRRLVEEGHDLRVTARPTSDTSLVRGLSVDVRVGDLADDAFIRNVAEECECVIHAAVDFDVAGGDQLAHFRTNLSASLQLLEMSRRNGAQFIFISTGAVHEKILDDRPLDEAHPLWPGATYGAYKAAVEAFLPAYKAQFNVNACAFRPTGIYGIHLTCPQRSHWHDLAQRVLRSERIDTKAGGKVIHAQDIADAVLRAIGCDEVAGEVFELTDCHIYDQVVAGFARDVAGTDAEIIMHDLPGPKHTIVCDKVRRTLGVRLGRGHEGVKMHIAELIRIMQTL